MNLHLYFVSLLVAFVLGSESNNETVQNSDSINPDNRVFIEANFKNAVLFGNVAECKTNSEKYEYLTNSFNPQIFSELINCFDAKHKEKQCWEIFEILKPSFLNVSHSFTSPVILALQSDKTELFTALLEMEGINQIIDKTDEFNRTALMYAAKKNSFYAVRRIIQLSKDSVNFKDSLGKTAIHYACEMESVSDNEENRAVVIPAGVPDEVYIKAMMKLDIVNMLMANNGQIFQNGPEYKLDHVDVKLKEIISEFNGPVVVCKKDNNKKFGEMTAILLGGMVVGANYKLLDDYIANPIFTQLSHLLFKMMQLVYPDTSIDINSFINLGAREIRVLLLYLIISSLFSVFKNFPKNQIRKVRTE